VRVLLVDDDETIRELLQSYLPRTPLGRPSCAPWVPGRIFTLVVAAVAMVSWLFPKDGAVAQARRLLRERLARGEITEAAYREAARALSASGKAERGLAPVVALLLLALLVLVLAGMGSGRGMHGPGWMAWAGCACRTCRGGTGERAHRLPAAPGGGSCPWSWWTSASGPRSCG
jgi:CheY-like chemotaxis protein